MDRRIWTVSFIRISLPDMVENKSHGFPLLPSFLSALDLSLTHVKGKIPFHSLCHSRNRRTTDYVVRYFSMILLWFICTQHDTIALVLCLPCTAPVMTGRIVVRWSTSLLHIPSNKWASRCYNFSYLFLFIVLTPVLVVVLNMIYLFIRC